MRISVELPDDLTQHPNGAREALEALAIEGYRAGTLSHHQAAQLLGLTGLELDGFLSERSIYDHAYSAQDLERDLADLERFQSQIS